LAIACANVDNILIGRGGVREKEFYRLLCPFFAFVVDGHTFLRALYKFNSRSPGGIHLYFKIVDEFLYVSAVTNDEYKNSLESLLISVGGVDFNELIKL